MADAKTKDVSKSLSRLEKPQADTRVRLNKYLADEGISSRRGADKIIEEGRITVNGKKVYELGIKVSPKTDKILFDGKPIRKNIHGQIVAMFHKPKGVLTTTEDPLGRPTITDYIKNLPVRLFPVGRLDWDSEGLILLTNDGDFAHRVMHPSMEVTKTYLVKVNGSPSREELDKLKSGVSIIGGRVKALVAQKFQKGDSKKNSWIKIIISEGKNRQIRQMLLKIGYDVIKLQRIAIGRLRIGALPKGEIVFLGEDAVRQIFVNTLKESAEALAETTTARETTSTRTAARSSTSAPEKLSRGGKTAERSAEKSAEPKKRSYSKGKTFSKRKLTDKRQVQKAAKNLFGG